MLTAARHRYLTRWNRRAAFALVLALLATVLWWRWQWLVAVWQVGGVQLLTETAQP